MIINGFIGAIPQPLHIGRNDAGNFSVLSWEGTKPEMIALAGQIANQWPDIPYDLSESFGKSRLEFHFPYTLYGIDASTDRVELWELFSQHADKDLLEAQVESNIIGTLSVAEIQLIRNKIISPPDVSSGQSDVQLSDFTSADTLAIQDAQTAGQPAPNPLGNAVNALKVYQLMQAGVRSYPVEVPTLRHTLTTSNQYAARASLANVRRIISTGTLESLQSIPNELLFNLPTDISANPNFAYGWYQYFPTVQQIAWAKWQIVQEWQYGLWATLIYGNPL